MRKKEETKQRRREQEASGAGAAWRRSAGATAAPGLPPGRGGRQVEVEVQQVERGTERAATAEPAISAPEPLPAARRPSLQPVRHGTDQVTVDLTAEDDTQALPRLDSLERKLKDLEQQFG